MLKRNKFRNLNEQAQFFEKEAVKFLKEVGTPIFNEIVESRTTKFFNTENQYCNPIVYPFENVIFKIYERYKMTLFVVLLKINK